MAPRTGFCEEHTKLIEELAALRTRQEALENENGKLRTAVDTLLELKGKYEGQIPVLLDKIEVLFDKTGKNYERMRNLEGEFGLLHQTVERIEEATVTWVSKEVLKETLRSYDFWLRVGLGGMAVAVLGTIATAVAKLLGWV